MFTIYSRFLSHVRLELVKWRVARSSGPGGQHVNTNNTKATLLYPLNKVDIALKPLLKAKPSNICDDNVTITSQKHRSLEMNKQECLELLNELFEEARKASVPKVTSPEQRKRVEQFRAHGDRVRLEEKRQRSDKKRQRNFNKKDLFS